MKVPAWDGIHEDGLALFRGDVSELAAITMNRAVPSTQLVALRGISGVLSLETL